MTQFQVGDQVRVRATSSKSYSGELGKVVMVGRSTDGVHYQGSYGTPESDPRSTFEGKLYFLDHSGQEFLLFGGWHSEANKEDGSMTIVLSRG